MISTDDLITAVRSDTRGGDSSSPAVSDSDIVRYANYGQERLQSLILKTNPTSFRTDTTITLVANQEAYAITDRIYADERIVNVQYSFNGESQYYVDLPERSFNQRNNSSQNRIQFYIRRSKTLLFNPIINAAGGYVRVTYERQIDSLAKRNGQISGTPSGAAINLSSPTTAQEAYLTAGTYICVSDNLGNVILRNGLISSYSSSVITLAANVSTYLVSGYALANLANCYVTIGRYTTTHCQLSDCCERYLVYYVQTELFDRDSSDDGSIARGKRAEIEQDIIQTYQDSKRDEQDIQVIEDDLILRCDFYD